jgi:hypothetical protein
MGGRNEDLLAADGAQMHTDEGETRGQCFGGSGRAAQLIR